MGLVGYILLATFAVCVLIVVIARVSSRRNETGLPPTVSVRVQGCEYAIPTPPAEKLASWLERKQANEANPNSCEAVPDDGEMLVPVSFFAPGCGLAGWSKYDYYWEARSRASWNGYNNLVVSLSDYEEAKAYIAEAKKRERMLTTTAELNNKGIELEKRGEIPAAIAIYEECIKLRYPATHAYWRLAVLYRKAKDRVNEVRVIRVALEVFPDDVKFTERLNKVLTLK